jgi:hypothetical protein
MPPPPPRRDTAQLHRQLASCLLLLRVRTGRDTTPPSHKNNLRLHRPAAEMSCRGVPWGGVGARPHHAGCVSDPDQVEHTVHGTLSNFTGGWAIVLVLVLVLGAILVLICCCC